MGELTNKIVMWRSELERQQASLGIMSVFDSICVYLGEQHNRELSYIDDIEQMDVVVDQAQKEIKQYQLQESLLLERLRKITLDYKRLKEDRRTTRFWEMAEENLKLATELAALKGEISG